MRWLMEQRFFGSCTPVCGLHAKSFWSAALLEADAGRVSFHTTPFFM